MYRPGENKKGLNSMKPLPALCDRDRIQTYNLLIRSQMLYSIELRSQNFWTDGKNKVKTPADKINVIIDETISCRVYACIISVAL